MAHITIEYSTNIALQHDVDELVSAVHDAALGHGLATITGLRTRAAPREHYALMSGEEHFAFVAIACRIGPGRDKANKSSFIEAVLDAAIDHLADTPLAIAWSIELTELDPELRINRNFVRDAMENQ